jgi:hypothetical protein
MDDFVKETKMYQSGTPEGTENIVPPSISISVSQESPSHIIPKVNGSKL